MLSTCDSRIKCISARWVSSFGNFRIKGCLAPPRNISPPRRVLHRLSKPRHPPYALICFSLLCWERRNLRTAIICCSPLRYCNCLGLQPHKGFLFWFLFCDRSIYTSSKRPAGSGCAMGFVMSKNLALLRHFANKKAARLKRRWAFKGLPSTSGWLKVG